MIGIYCWTNKITGEQYVGQSVDMSLRKKQHIYNYAKENSKEYEKSLYRSMRKYGIENFTFSILEECTVEELDQKECFWIKKLNTYIYGFNENIGGECNFGEYNPNSKLTDNDVLIIRKRIYINNEYPKDVYKDYQNIIGYDRFWSAAHGDTWKHVDCSMIKPIAVNNIGSKNPKAKLNEQDVIQIRNRKYLNAERTIDIYEDYKDRISFSAFEKAILGTTWKNVPMPNVNTCID